MYMIYLRLKYKKIPRLGALIHSQFLYSCVCPVYTTNNRNRVSVGTTRERENKPTNMATTTVIKQ